jgi:hypothetical protein
MNETSGNPDNSDDDEDPIVAEVRKAREELFARFNYDLHALFEYLRAQTEESARAGRKVAPLPPTSPPSKRAG